MDPREMMAAKARRQRLARIHDEITGWIIVACGIAAIACWVWAGFTGRWP